MHPEDEVLDDVDVTETDEFDDVEVDDSLPDDDPQDDFPELKPSVGFEDEVVRIGGREFTIDEPDIGITLRILKVIGRLFVRGDAARRLSRLQPRNSPTAASWTPKFSMDAWTGTTAGRPRCSMQKRSTGATAGKTRFPDGSWLTMSRTSRTRPSSRSLFHTGDCEASIAMPDFTMSPT